MTPLRRIARRAPALLHAGFVGACSAAVFVAVHEVERAFPRASDALLVVLASLIVAGLARLFGAAINQSFRGMDTNTVVGRADLNHIEITLSQLVHEFVSDLTAMQGEVQLMISKLHRLREALLRFDDRR